MEAVHADWKEYLNLLICEESHLKFMEDYHQVPIRLWGAHQRRGSTWGTPSTCLAIRPHTLHPGAWQGA